MNRSEGLERADKVFEDSLKVVAASERANDHGEDEVGEIYDELNRASSALDGHSHAHGFDTGRKDDGIDPYYFWPKSEAGREDRQKYCKICKTPKPYSEFTRVDGSQRFTGTTCDMCLDVKGSYLSRPRARRRRDESARIGAVGAAGTRT